MDLHIQSKPHTGPRVRKDAFINNEGIIDIYNEVVRGYSSDPRIVWRGKKDERLIQSRQSLLSAPSQLLTLISAWFEVDGKVDPHIQSKPHTGHRV